MKKLFLLLTFISFNSFSETYPLDYWAVRNGVANFNISNEGTYVSYVYRGSKRSDPVIHILETDDLTKKPKVIGADKMRIQGHYWVDDERMVVSFIQRVRDNIRGFNQGVYASKLALLDVKKGEFTELDKQSRVSSAKSSVMRYVNSLPFEKNKILVGYIDDSRKSGVSAYSYYKLDLNNFKKKLVLKGNDKYYSIRFNNKGEPTSALSDNRGRRETIFYYRTGEEGSKQWTEYYRQSFDTYETFYPLGPVLNDKFEWDEESLYVVANNGRDKEGLWTYNINTQKYGKLIYEDDVVDIAGGIYYESPNQEDSKLVGFRTFSDRERRYYLSGERSLEVESLYYQLEQIIPNAYEVDIISETDDKSSFIVRNIAPNDPGSYYLYHKNQFQFLANVKPFLDSKNLAKLSYIEYPSSDGTIVRAYVHTPAGGTGPYPAIVIPHGGPFVSETITFDRVAQFFANNGYVVIQPQYRGSFNYGIDFHQKAFINGGQGGKLMQDDKDYAAKYLVKNGLIDKDNIFMWGGSYGGYAALIAATNDMYKCSAGFAVVSDTKQQISYYANRLDGLQKERQMSYALGSISPVDVTDQVKIPLLIIHGDDDQRTPIKHAYNYVEKLKENNIPHEFVVLEGADHFFDTLTYDHFVTLFEKSLDFYKTCGE